LVFTKTWNKATAFTRTWNHSHLIRVRLSTEPPPEAPYNALHHLAAQSKNSVTGTLLQWKGALICPKFKEAHSPESVWKTWPGHTGSSGPPSLHQGHNRFQSGIFFWGLQLQSRSVALIHCCTSFGQHSSNHSFLFLQGTWTPPPPPLNVHTRLSQLLHDLAQLCVHQVFLQICVTPACMLAYAGAHSLK